ncbi:glycosyltransferase [Sphingobium sp. LF-16]|uniref:glycosyltransferase n=1 Tax=Sphingobium sp. LF-16 TaxID=2185111 RepID=UPI0013DE0214|nr:glycosyltransferase [Sphingobium sp. LF-16]
MSNFSKATHLSVSDRTAYINFEGDSATNLVELRIDGQRAPFRPCDDKDALAQVGGPIFHFDWTEINQTSRSVPAESKSGEYFACWVNHLPDWSLSGSQTLQLLISKATAPCQIIFGNPLIIDATSTPMSVKIALAAHRAKASLNVDVTDLESGDVKRQSVAFDPEMQGGTTLAGYQNVEFLLPNSPTKKSVALSIEYHSALEDRIDIEPFMFIADARVAPTKESENQSAIVTKSLISRGAPKRNNWMSAQFPAFVTEGSDIEIFVNGELLEKFAAPNGNIAIKEDYGHTIILNSDADFDILMYVDGEFSTKIRVGVGDTIVHMPTSALDGTNHHVAFKDESASFVYLECVLLVPAVITPVEIMQRETPPPFPDSIFAQTARRYASLKKQMALGDGRADFGQIAYALSVLEGGYGKVRLKPLQFPVVTNPDVSIIIPAHNKVEVTYLALCSLLVAHNHASFEVIVVDDGSTDETATLEEFVSGITVVHNAEALRFIGACNAGAELARGRFIALLNNDVEVTSGWLDELIATFDRFERVGLAGAKLLYPDGKLQDAGGIIWGTGNPWNYGNRQNPNAPNFSYARQADYLSGAALMVPIDLWREIGGLSTYLSPMYFEDTDLSFKVREAGYTTWFTPSSVVYHYEGMTSGTDVSKGFKRFQEVNRPKFKRRWAQAYSNFGKEGHRPDLEKDRGIVGRVLFIDYSTPRGDQDAGSYAALNEMKLVQSLGYKVTFLPMNMAHLGSYTENLQKIGVEVIYAPFFMTVNDYLSKHGQDFDAFYITRYYVAQDVITQLRSIAPHSKILFNNADLHFLREIRAARSDGDEDLLKKAIKTRDEELSVIRKVDAVLSYNEVEHSVIDAYTDGEAKVLHCPWVVESVAKPIAINERVGLSFLGGFRHHPNEAGICWFANTVAPLLPDSQTYQTFIYGSSMTDKVRALKSPKMEPVGFVPDVADAFDQHRVFVAPLLSGAGIKGKVLSALAYGIPCVLTPVAAEGIGLRSGHDCIIAESAEDWRKAIVALCEDDELWERLSANALTYMRNSFSFENGRNYMRKAFEAVDLFRSLS